METRTERLMQRDDAIERGYREGQTLAHLGRVMDMTKEGVRRVLIKRGVPIRPPGPEPKPSADETKARVEALRVERNAVMRDEAARARILKERRKGKTVYEIAEAVDLAPETIVAVLHRASEAEIAAVLDT